MARTRTNVPLSTTSTLRLYGDGSKMVGQLERMLNTICIDVYSIRSLRQRHYLSMSSAHDERDRMMPSAPLL
jgi:predicted transcriptional regulator